MPLDDRNWNGGEGGGEPEYGPWSFTTDGAITRLDTITIQCGQKEITFPSPGCLPAGTTFVVQLFGGKHGLVTYRWPNGDLAMFTIDVPVR